LSGSVDEVIRAWEPSLGSRTIVAQPDTGIPSIALSDTSLVWVGTHGPDHTDGGYTAAELYWAPFPAGMATASIGGSTSLPAISGLMSMQTWGDFAAVLGTDPLMKLDLFVVRLSDGHLWTIHPRPGTTYMRLLAVTTTEILFGTRV